MDTIAMKFLLPLLLLFPLSTLADDKDYDQCILDYQRTAKSGVAVHFITQACDKLYNDGSFLLSREKAYYECLLENLPGGGEQPGGAEDQERLRIEVAELIWRGGERK
ncbi:hypothetical protein PYX07_00810 [Pseudomonas aeruginosa]|nr:hypothetical protein [Pseudomonas aeruginosa]